MGRWDPDARGRLQYAAMALYLDRGYEDVTVAEIAESAGLTKRTFFRHFPDKREVIFAGAPDFQAGVVAGVRSAPPGVVPISAVIAALAGTHGTQLARYAEYTRARRDLVASSADLQERELIKLAALTTAVAEALRDRGVDPVQARLTASAGVTAYTVAYDRWADDDGVSDLPTLLHRSLEGLRTALGPAGTAPG